MFTFAPLIEKSLIVSKPQSNILSIATGFPVDFLSISGQNYELVSGINQLEPGQYKIINNDSIEVSLLPNTDRKLLVNYKSTNLEAKETQYSLDNLIRLQGNINAVIKVKRTILGHPSLQISLIDHISRLPLYDAIKIDQEYNLFNLKFRVSSKNILEDPLNEKLTVNYSLQGIWANYGDAQNPLDYPIRISSFSDCNKSTNTVSVAKIASRLGIKYKGKDFFVKVPYNVGEKVITLRGIIQERASYVGGFPYWSNPDCVEVRDWKPKTHVINSSGKIKKTATSYIGQNKLTNSEIQLKKIYRNHQIVLDSGNELVNEESDNIDISWSFKKCGSLGDLQTPAIPEGLSESGFNFYRLPGEEVLRNPANAYDNNGHTKSATKTNRKRGRDLFAETWVWGWVNTSLDNYEVRFYPSEEIPRSLENLIIVEPNDREYKVFYKPTQLINRYWRQVKYIRTDWVYGSDGYLIAKIETTTRLGRTLQDNSSLPAIKYLKQYFQLNYDALQTENIEERNRLRQLAIANFNLSQAYKFDRQFTETRRTFYRLTSLSKYFDDLKPPTDEDCNWVEPKFNSWKLTTTNSVKVIDNPANKNNDSVQYPPIITGHVETQATKVEILSSKGRGRIKVSNYISDERNQGLEQKFELTDSRVQSGRPSTHDRLPLEKPEEKGGNLNQYKKNKNKKYLITTVGTKPISTYNVLYPIVEGSTSIPDITSISNGLKIMQLRSDITNSLESQVRTITFDEQSGIDEGDIFFDEGIAYVVKSSTITYSFINQAFCREQTLELGLLLETKLSLRTVLVNNKQSPRTSRGVAIDGSLTQLKNIYSALSSQTTQRAAQLGLLETLAEKTGNKVYGLNEITDPDKDLQEDYLTNNNLTDSTKSDSKPPIDLREKTDIEELTDLINRESLLTEFNDILNNLVNQQFVNNQNEQQQNQVGSSPQIPLGTGSSNQTIIDFEQPTLILEGGDGLLTELLNKMLGSLQTLLKTLTIGSQSEESGGGGGAGGGSGGGGGGGGAGGAGQVPVFQTGERIIYAPSLDIDGILAAILAMIEAATEEAENFELTINEIVDLASQDELADQEAQQNAAPTGGAANAGGQQSGGVNITTIYTQPEGVEPAIIRTIFPPNISIEDLDLTEIFEKFDNLMQLLDRIANENYDFDLDLDLLEPEAGLAPSKDNSISSPIVTNTSSSGGGGSNTSVTITVVAQVEDITGIIGGGVSGATDFPSSFSSGGGGAGGSGGGSGGGAEGGESFGTGSSSNSGNPGEFTEQNNTIDNVTNEYYYSPEGIVISDATPTGFTYPYSAIEPTSDQELEAQFINAPDEITRILNGQAATIRLSDITASQLVFWSLVQDIPGVEILTPYDINPTIKFSNEFPGGQVPLRISLRTHNLSKLVIINTSPIEIVRFNDLTQKVDNIIWSNFAVDLSTLKRKAIFDSGLIVTNQINYSWEEPSTIHSILGYRIESFIAGEWQEVILTTQQEYQFESNIKYRIGTIYQNLGEIISNEFTFEEATIVNAPASLVLTGLVQKIDEISLQTIDRLFSIGTISSNTTEALTLDSLTMRIDNNNIAGYDLSDRPFYANYELESINNSLNLSDLVMKVEPITGLSYTPLGVFYSN